MQVVALTSCEIHINNAGIVCSVRRHIRNVRRKPSRRSGGSLAIVRHDSQTLQSPSDGLNFFNKSVQCSSYGVLAPKKS